MIGNWNSGILFLDYASLWRIGWPGRQDFNNI